MIRVLYVEGCPNYEATLRRVRHVVKRTGVQMPVDAVKITTPEQARALGFHGSPTVQLNGHDIDPRFDFVRPAEFACRVYTTDKGTSGVPPTKLIEDAFRRHIGELVRDLIPASPRRNAALPRRLPVPPVQTGRRFPTPIAPENRPQLMLA